MTPTPKEQAVVAAELYLQRGCYGTHYADHDTVCRLCPLARLLDNFAARQPGEARQAQRQEDIHGCADRIAAALRQMDQALANYGEHTKKCILSYCEGGRPTADGGYEHSYQGRWYSVKPVDHRPACTCGFDAALAASGGVG